MTAVDEITAPVTVSTLPGCPYRGLDPFTEANRNYFFGREEMTMTISANLLTAPVTVLYGTSGVGKSSVLMAGVVPFVRSQPRTTVVLFRSWQRTDLIAALNDEVEKAVRQKTDEPVDKRQGFDVCVASAVAATKGALTIVFDQFEEFLLYHGPESESGVAFDRQFARLANREDAPVNFLLAIREDCVAKLDRFQRHIPHLLTNLLRLDQLDVAGARRATVDPIMQYNAELALRHPDAPPYSIEPALVEEVLAVVQSGAVARPGEGLGTLAHPADAKAVIETPFLQMILIAVWKAEKKKGSPVMRLETLAELGGADRIVRNYVDDIVQPLPAELHEVCARMFDRFVTPSRTKIAHSIEDLEEMVGEDCRNGVRAVIAALSTGNRRILRIVKSPTEVARYEIFHDVLAHPILQWRARYQSDKRSREERLHVGRKRLLAMAAALLVAIGIVLYMGVDELRAMERRRTRNAAAELLGEAKTHVRNGRPGQAQANLVFARRLYDSVKDGAGPTAIEDVSASLLEAGNRRQRAEAVPYYKAVVATTGDERRRVRALLYLANAQLQMDGDDDARRTLAEATRSKALPEMPRLQLRAAELWAVASVYEKATTLLASLLEASRTKGDEATIADTQYALGLIHKQKGEHLLARTALTEALRLQRRDADKARTLAALGAVYVALGDAPNASRVREEADVALRATGDLAALLDRPESSGVITAR